MLHASRNLWSLKSWKSKLYHSPNSKTWQPIRCLVYSLRLHCWLIAESFLVCQLKNGGVLGLKAAPDKSSRPEVFCKKGVLRNFSLFTEKHLCQRLFFKESLAQVFSCEFCKISKNTFCYRTPPVAASNNWYIFLLNTLFWRHIVWCILVVNCLFFPQEMPYKSCRIIHYKSCINKYCRICLIKLKIGMI